MHVCMNEDEVESKGKAEQTNDLGLERQDRPVVKMQECRGK